MKPPTSKLTSIRGVWGGETENHTSEIKAFIARFWLVIRLFMSTLGNYVVPQNLFKNKITEIVRNVPHFAIA